MKIDYEAIYEVLKIRPVTRQELLELGIDPNSMTQVITTLSLKYPVYDIERGVYGLSGYEEKYKERKKND
jgi:hypothetical protein